MKDLAAGWAAISMSPSPSYPWRSPCPIRRSCRRQPRGRTIRRRLISRKHERRPPPGRPPRRRCPEKPFSNGFGIAVASDGGWTTRTRPMRATPEAAPSRYPAPAADLHRWALGRFEIVRPAAWPDNTAASPDEAEVVRLRRGVPYRPPPAAGLWPVASTFEKNTALYDGGGPRGSCQRRWAAPPGVHRRSSPPILPLTEMGIGAGSPPGG